MKRIASLVTVWLVMAGPTSGAVKAKPARDATLVLADLPDGWSIDSSPLKVTHDCQNVTKNIEAGATSKHFARFEDSSTSLFHGVAVHADAKKASWAFAGLDGYLKRCKNWTAKSGKDVLTISIGAMNITLTPKPDEVKAWKQTAQVNGFSLTGHVIAYRKGPTLGVVGVSGGFVDLDSTKSLTLLAASKA